MIKIEIADLEIIQKHLKEIADEIKLSKIFVENRKTDPERSNRDLDLDRRIADLEIKMSKLWGMLVDASPVTKEEKLSKTGKRFSKLF